MNMQMRASDTRWLTPVYVRIGHEVPEAIRSPREALNQLLYRWPPVYGEAYHLAKQRCSLAMAGKTSCEASREAFIMACIEAKVLD
ncbi:DUF982 domain-containing protein [Neorhizobium sp. SOG26]|jgi:Protein of unknown function (DUF982).|uniref:DUF982 domain-containing protein n=1 Tax=Neorhizobium turbinariae TaxID=2937795 RepID=A0ABT0IWH6_9HYPH|nr:MULTISPECIES: DUF982 domain-containing protein [Neorhizobium]AXV16073.1 DUF982 domain-containing protein [Neorhizobium sp. SOG26]MCK8782116.1 DUF982 domain-containing protein [Neorhizobium turbinariae]